MNNFRVEKNALFSLVVVLAIAALMVWLVGSTAHQSITYSRQVRQLTDAIENILELQGHLIDLETGERGYLITGEPVFLEPHHQALAELDKHLARVDETLRQVGVARESAEELMRHVAVKRAISVANVRVRGNGFDAARKRVEHADGKREMDRIRASLDGMIHELTMRRSELRKLRDDAQDTLKLNIVLAALVMVAVALVLHVRLLKLMRLQYAAELKMAHLATHDELTGLPNRRLMMEHLELALQRSKRNGSQMALLFLDLNGFKPINDQYGHEAGDKMLKMVALRLARMVRASDLVARLGGDEFVLLVADLADKEGVCGIIAKINAEIAHPVLLHDGIEVGVTASVGVALYPRDGEDIEALLSHADAAMYEAKRTGSNCYCREQKPLRRCILNGDGK